MYLFCSNSPSCFSALIEKADPAHVLELFERRLLCQGTGADSTRTRLGIEPSARCLRLTGLDGLDAARREDDMLLGKIGLAALLEHLRPGLVA